METVHRTKSRQIYQVDLVVFRKGRYVTYPPTAGTRQAVDQDDWLTLAHDPVMYSPVFHLYLMFDDLYCFLLLGGKNTTYL